VNIQEIQDLRRATPFVPFILELDNGNRIAVRHPDVLFIPPNERFVIVANEHLHVIAPSSISQIEDLTKHRRKP